MHSPFFVHCSHMAQLQLLFSVHSNRFMYAFQHLERIGRLRAARFTITQDIVPLIPFHGLTRPYKHVGMHIRLLGVDWYAQHWLR